MISRLLLFLLILGLLPSTGRAWPARVVAVADGDTLTVESLCGDDRETIRLHGVDAPENRHAAGAEARQFVASRALFKQVDVLEVHAGRNQRTKDRWGRKIAQIILPGGKALQEELLTEGHAGCTLNIVMPAGHGSCSKSRSGNTTEGYGKKQPRSRPGSEGRKSGKNPAWPRANLDNGESIWYLINSFELNRYSRGSHDIRLTFRSR